MLAALINSLKLAKKTIEGIKIVINGAGAAGISICRFLLDYGAKNVIVCDKAGTLVEGDDTLNPAQREIAKITNREKLKGTLKDAFVKADVFIGVSGPDCVTEEMVASMNERSIVFTLANPVPEINPISAKKAGAFIVGTGSSVYPNQINNALVFPGLFRGAIDARAKDIDSKMMIAASKGIAGYVKEELSVEHVLPFAVDKGAHKAVAKAVYDAAVSDPSLIRRD